MAVYVCTNPDCAEHGVDKSSEQLYDPPPICGACNEPTELGADTKPAP